MGCYVSVSLKIAAEQAVDIAIERGSVQSVNTLINQLKGPHQLTDADKLLYLDIAVRRNQPYMVAYFLESLSNLESLSHFGTDHFSLRTIERMDLSILQQLREAGVPFSEKANGVIAKKEHQSIGIVLSIGIAICKFTEFLKEQLFKLAETNPNITKCRDYARKLRDMVNRPDPQEKDTKDQRNEQTNPNIVKCNDYAEKLREIVNPSKTPQSDAEHSDDAESQEEIGRKLT